jgi:hypothetical protein
MTTTTYNPADAKMAPSSKAIIQDPAGRGYSNGKQWYLGNDTNEVTFNVELGYNILFHYYHLGLLKFASLEDAMQYVAECGATEGTIDGKEYYSVCKQDGCCFSYFGSYSVK